MNFDYYFFIITFKENIEMKGKWYILCFLMILCSSMLIGAEGEGTQFIHSIDEMLDDCLSIGENQSTQGMIKCIQKAVDDWMAEIEKYNKKLISVLNDEEKTLFQEAKQQWENYRDCEFAFIEKLYYNKDGTMWHIILYERKLQIIKTRAMTLMTSYDDYVFE